MIDPPPLPPMPHMTSWWAKYRHTSGLVTEAIAPNRQNITKMSLGVFTPYKLKRGIINVAPLTITIGYVYYMISSSDAMNHAEHRKHWD